MLLSEITAEGWTLVVGAVGVVAVQLMGMYLQYLRDTKTAARVKEVKETLETVNTVTDAKLNTVISDIHKVELATNSMKDQLVAATEKEALARGGHEERVRVQDLKEKEKEKEKESGS